MDSRNNDELLDQSGMSEEEIYAKLKENGLRMTQQRKIIIDIITHEEYSCCKEIYVLAHRRDESIGIATVYRMLNVLEDIGAINRKNIEKASCNGRCCDMKGGCTVVTEDSKRIMLSEDDIQEALKYIMKKNGYANVDDIKAVLIKQ